MSEDSRPPAYFERLYAGNPDPWAFETSAYEHEKYDATIAALGGRRFANAIEIGCSIGVLTARLAAHCDQLLAVDVVESALARAKARCAGLANVHFETRRLPQDWPEVDQKYDLIVLSEVLYFLNTEDIRRLAERAAASLAPGGYALLVNYTETIDEPCSGREAAETFRAAASGLTCTLAIIRQKYRIDLLAANSFRQVPDHNG
jgi:cyclopropane fatty-acyl-phospholipid synthase-like methyltransferase